MVALENVKEAYYSIKSNFVRSLLTLLIIAVGIACLVGILTAIDAILFSMNSNFNRLGANSLSIKPRSETLSSNREGRDQRKSTSITIEQALEFKERFSGKGAAVSVDAWCIGNVTIKSGSEKTNPTFQLRGIDENFLLTSSFELIEGRNFLKNETYKAIVGSEVVKVLFGEVAKKAIGKEIVVEGDRYTIVGVLKQNGSGSADNSDKRVYIPLDLAKNKYGYPEKNYNVSLAVQNPTQIDPTIEAAIAVMRNIRALKPGEENDFEIAKSDSILNRLKEMTSTLRWATMVIAMLTLLGASIGLMNIMLVSVTERTREIGVRKSLGATGNNILMQFLTEAVTICIFGGIVGILLGIGIGFGVNVLVKGSFFIPWAWMILGMVVCVFVGVISGLYPALKASKLDPIEALRYE